MTQIKVFKIVVGDTVFTEDGAKFTVQGIFYDLNKQPVFTITDGRRTLEVAGDSLSLQRTNFLMREIARVTKQIEDLSGGEG